METRTVGERDGNKRMVEKAKTNKLCKELQISGYFGEP